MKSYDLIRAERPEAGIYAAAQKIEPGVKAYSLRLAATALKNAKMRERVEYVLTQALYNADDTMVDGYGSPERKEYATRDAFWDMIFKASIADVASRESKQVARFFTSRGIQV